MADKSIQVFKSGVSNLVSEEIIAADAASDEKNWFTQDGRIKLAPGKVVVGAPGVVGNVTGEIFGYRADGTKVHWRKIGAKIQYLNGITWTDVITGLTPSADYTFFNYSSLAGTFTFATGVDGIYKMNNASAGSYIALYDPSINFKGYAFIDKGRMILWNRPGDPTGLYGSKIDPQNSTVYTTVTGEVLGASGSTNYTGTLAFKGSNPLADAFGILVTGTTAAGVETFTDAFGGVLTGSLGGTGTINYITGAYNITFNGVVTSGNVTANYQWENSNSGGVTDFRHSATRLAGEGFVFPQDEGGDKIITVLIGSDGYYSLKSQSAYLLSIDSDDLGADNNVYRKQMGIQSLRGGISTSEGIIFMNTANAEKPEMTILTKNLADDSLVPKVLFSQFRFANYDFSDCTMDTYERYVMVFCKTVGAVNNDTLLLCDVTAKTVDITSNIGRTVAQDGTSLYMGSSVSQSVYQILNGYDDDGFSIDNYWTGKGETWGTENLKKYRKIRLKGKISVEQSYQVYVNYDDNGPQLVGTVLGSGSYVDYTSPQTIGSNFIGSAQIGGDDVSDIYPYFLEIRLKKVPKFRKRKMTFKALGIGYLDIDTQLDMMIDVYEQKIPARFRQKQNVALAGDPVNQDTPEF